MLCLCVVTPQCLCIITIGLSLCPGLEKLQKLRYLDLRKNRIRTELSTIGKILNGLRALEAVG